MWRSPSPSDHTDVSTTESEDEEEHDRYMQENVPVDVLQDMHIQDVRRLYPYPGAGIPQIHRGPQLNSIHTTFRKDESIRYKIVLAYKQPPKEFALVLRILTHSLLGARPVLKCKVFTDPTRSDRKAFVYLGELSVTELLDVVGRVERALNPLRIDLRTPEAKGKVLMEFASGSAFRNERQ